MQAIQGIQRWARRMTLWRRQGPTSADALLVQQILARATQFRPAADRELADQVTELRSAVQGGADPLSEGILIPMSALLHEAARRTLGIEIYDVQHLAGLSLARGQVAQMQTGEGKTYAAALPAALHALAGRGVHVMTSNGYLAQRDCELLRPLFAALGLSVGLLRDDAAAAAQCAAYACDITYGHGCQFAFDYLRDQVARQQQAPAGLGHEFRRALRGRPSPPMRTMQRGLVWAIVDEADHVLIDDAGSPLILSDRAPRPAPDAAAHVAARRQAGLLAAGRDFDGDARQGGIRLSASGKRRIYEDASVIPTDVMLRPWSHYVELALRAERVFRRDAQYVVRGGEVQIVDATTGRIFADRTWQAGLHQAIQAKEGLEITAETQPLAQITRQRFFRLYEHLCGMTGTAWGGEGELRRFYRLPVAEVPLRKPSRRTVLPTRYFACHDAKWSAIAADAQRLHAVGRPVLIGTPTIAESEELAARLLRLGVAHQILNGRQDADEARIVAAAGRLGAITVATNIAGRGTDIRLPPEVVALGGLHVIAAGRHEAGRIDRQLVGRCARQGEPGSAQFFVAADDLLIERYAPWLAPAMRRLANAEGEVLVDLDAPVRRIQRRAERADYARRRRLFRHDRYRNQIMSRFAGAS